MKILELENEPLSKLRAIAKSLNIPNYNRLKKESLAMMIREAEAQKDALVTALEPFAGGGGHAYGYDDCRHCTAYQVLARVRSGEGKQ